MEQDQIQQLISQLQNGNERHRRAAAYKLGKTKDPIVVPVLISAYTTRMVQSVRTLLMG